MKIAILIRGQLREWNNSKSNIFQAFKPFEENHEVTYFFATWDTSYVNVSSLNDPNVKLNLTNVTNFHAEQIRRDFDGKNLVLKIVDSEKAKNMFDGLSLQEEYQNISFIRHFVGMMKQNYEIENDVEFDLVIETRPDIFIQPYLDRNFAELKKIPNFAFHSTSEFLPRGSDKIHVNSKFFDFNTMFVDDLMFISNGLTSDIITGEFCFLFHNRDYYFIKMIHPHNILCDYFLNMKLINIHNISEFFSNISILRPLKFFDSPVNLFNPTDATMDQIVKANLNFAKQKQ